MQPIVGSVMSVSLRGLEARRVLVEAALLAGLPSVSIVGLADAAVHEAKERLRASFSHIGIQWPNQKLTLNLSPADTEKSGSGYDLAIASAIFGALGYRTLPRTAAVIGELGLDGSVRAVRGVLPCALGAVQQGFTHLYVPQANVEEAQLVPGLQVIPVAHLGQMAGMLGVSHAKFEVAQYSYPEHNSADLFAEDSSGDMSDVYGQNEAIWALMVAAVGGHHVQMVGPPGVGKSMLAQRFPAILPPLSEREAVEVAAIRSLGGMRVTELPRCRPLAAPHHSASTPALVGGGAGIPSPGAVTFAHHGVLFCDEFPEFSARSIQALRQPMETGWVDLHRTKAHVRYPARFQLIAAANPCRCGHALDGHGLCVCKAHERATYRSNLGGPIRDRFDIRLVLNRPSKAQLAAGSTMTTQEAREVIGQARERSSKRLEAIDSPFTLHTNSQIPGSWLRRYTKFSPRMEQIIDRQLTLGQISLRGLDRMRRVAWSIADIRSHEIPSDEDIAAAFTLRGGDEIYGE
ncbi:Competence protein ComM [Chlamydia trachomatis]|nr:Competence protein ComM [Chlamydia trachomatis]